MRTSITLYLLLVSLSYGSDQLNVAQFTTRPNGNLERSTVEIGFTSKDDNGSRRANVRMDFDGRLCDANGKSRPIKNSDSTVVGFNIRYGVGIYGMGLVALRDDGSCSVIPNLEEVLGRQIKKVNVALNPESLLLYKIESHSLSFHYTGEEVSPNYFDVYATILDGKIVLDEARLKRDMPK